MKHIYETKQKQTSNCCLSSSNLFGRVATACKFIKIRRPPHNTGWVCKHHCSVKIPAFPDLNTKGILMVRPGRIMPERKETSSKTFEGISEPNLLVNFVNSARVLRGADKF